MRKFSIAPVIAVIFGVAGFLLRRAERLAVFDIYTGLAEKGAPESVRLFILTAAALLAALIAAIYVRIKTSRGKKTVLPEPVYGAFYFVLISLSGLIILIAALLNVIKVPELSILSRDDIIYSALAALSGICIFLTVLFCQKHKNRIYAMYFSVIPPIFLCYRLIIYYKENAANPNLLDYAYQSMALIFSILTMYFICGAINRRAAPVKTSFCCFMAIYFNAVACADYNGLYYGLVFCAVAVIAMAHMFSLAKTPIKTIRKGENDGSY